MMSCPICARKTDPSYRPFCSKRCANIDLGKWLGGTYSIPEEEPEDWGDDTTDRTDRTH